jgi:hypothetical protein
VEILADSEESALSEAHHVEMPEDGEYAGGFAPEWAERIDELPDGYLDLVEDEG